MLVEQFVVCVCMWSSSTSAAALSDGGMKSVQTLVARVRTCASACKSMVYYQLFLNHLSWKRSLQCCHYELRITCWRAQEWQG